MIKLLMLALAPLLLAAAPPVDVETRKDVQCLVAVSALANSDDQTAKLSALIGSQYFLGRIDGQDPAFDLEAAIVAEAANLTEANMKSLLIGCGQLMQSRGAALISIGEHMQQSAAHSSSSSS